MLLDTNIENNIKHFDSLFYDCQDVVKRTFFVGEDQLKIFTASIDNLSSREIIDQQILDNLLVRFKFLEPNTLDNYNFIKETGIVTSDVTEGYTLEEMTTAVLSGDTILLIDGYAKGVIISSKGWDSRGVSPSETEVNIQGPKDAFTETFRTNTVLIRRRIRDTRLKIKQMQLGTRTKTDIALVYMEDLVRKEILDDLFDRLSNIQIDGIIDSGQLEQLIEKDWVSPFPQFQLTERPDKASSAILEGRIIIVVDNTPFVLIAPVTLNTFYQSSDDYYQRWEIVTFVRIIRFIAGFIAVALPGLYIALTVYHPQMIPMELTLKMASARAEVPFPAVVEILIMELAFELLREAGIRLPGPVGSTIGIVGGIVIGQAVVEAGIIGPTVVVIVALTGVASFAVPNIALVAGYRLIKYFIIIISALFGLYGFMIGLFLILTHLVNLESFGIPYLYPFCSQDVNDYTDIKDSLIRMPLLFMKKRPVFANPHQAYRMKKESEKGEKNDPKK